MPSYKYLVTFSTAQDDYPVILCDSIAEAHAHALSTPAGAIEPLATLAGRPHSTPSCLGYWTLDPNGRPIAYTLISQFKDAASQRKIQAMTLHHHEPQTLFDGAPE